MTPTEYHALLACITLVALGYVALGFWFWRQCENAPLDPEDLPVSSESMEFLRTRDGGRFWSE